MTSFFLFRPRVLLYFVFVLVALAPPVVRADFTMASPFTDHMVLQRELPVPVWGTADADEKITVTFAGQSKSTTAAVDGKWRVTLDPLVASASPRELTVSAINGESKIENRKFHDVVVGEVWLASGQSNMDFSVSKKAKSFAGVINEEQEIAAANYPLIRMFSGEYAKSNTPEKTIGGKWLVCSPETVPGFSAVGYFFARELQKEINVPVGIVALSFGASCAQAWIRREPIAADSQLKPVLDDYDAKVKAFVPLTSDETKNWEDAVAKAKAAGERAPRRPRSDPVQDQHNPTVLFNGMIAPVIPYAIRGVIWYQGESITAPKELFPRWNETLIADWRKLWGREIPFYFCQLAALDNASNSPLVREWQAEALKIPATGMVVTIDIGDPKSVHPKNKAPVGERLSRIALANVYGRKIEFSGPRYEGMAIEDGAIRVKFSHTAGGLVAKDGPLLKQFEIAGADGNFEAADAKIMGDNILVTHSEIPTPTMVRYAWANYPEGANLYNSAGLPAAPFRTK